MGIGQFHAPIITCSRLCEVVCAHHDGAPGGLPGVVFLARLLLDDGFAESLHCLVGDADNERLSAGGLGPVNSALAAVERLDEIDERHLSLPNGAVIRNIISSMTAEGNPISCAQKKHALGNGVASFHNRMSTLLKRVVDSLAEMVDFHLAVKTLLAALVPHVASAHAA
jgi:hypothetical protein